MQRAALIVGWMIVIVTGAFLRFDDLAKRPFHADEATGARITARRMESGGGQFDPKHYHGPTLHLAAAVMSRASGESGWREMRKSTLRALPAVAGTVLLFVPLLWRRRCGDVPMLLAAAFLATSPLLVYFSRMFIHESLLVLFGMLAFVSLTYKPRWGIAGILIGLMFATKESFAISILAWAGAGMMIALENRKALPSIRHHAGPIALCLLAAALVSSGFYTDGFQHPKGAIDAVRTFFVYETVEGHDKPFGYYFKLLALPRKSGGVWWFGSPIVVLALAAFASSFRKSAANPSIIRFTAYAAAGHFAIYSFIAYKTPWLACLPWAHVCLLAGFAAAGYRNHRMPVKAALAILTMFALVSQFQQTRRATGRLASDDRNPFAYVPTRGDVEELETWLQELRKAAPAGSLEPVAVVGADYWPLPWYLRSFETIGYWKEPENEIADLPLVFALPETADAVAATLEKSHTMLPRGLRSGVPVYLFMRNDVWKRWMER